jgi:glutathionylspermidine amidase/synthetase
MAYDIFRLRSVRVVGEDRRLPLQAFRNGSLRYPEPGALLIRDEGGEFEHAGHVAVVTEATEEAVRIIEQNHEDRVWPDGQDFSHSLRAEVPEDGEYWIENPARDAIIPGWMIQTDDDLNAEPARDQPRSV